MLWRYWEWEMAAREKRRKFLQKVLPCLRPVVKEDQPRAPQEADQNPEHGTPPRYASRTSLLSSKEVKEGMVYV
jgi:hypothetical protein